MSDHRQRLLDGEGVPWLVSAGPAFVLAALFLSAWVAPDQVGRWSIRELNLLLMFEFLVVHSAAFLAILALTQPSRPRQIGMIVLVSVLYMIFIGAVSLSLGQWWPLLSFLGLTANRLFPYLAGPGFTSLRRRQVQRQWSFSFAAYLLSIVPAAFLPLPSWGITPEIAERQRLSGSGILIEEPHRILAWGFLYFLLLALWNVFAGIRRSERSERPIG